jgi:hypothetical protein
MTDNNTPAPAPKDAVLTDDEILDAIAVSANFDELDRAAWSPESLALGRAIESALLSKLGAPVGGERETTAPVTGVAQYTKKPVTISAIRWNGKNLRQVIAFTDGPPETRTIHAGMAWESYEGLVGRGGLKIYTLEGEMLANKGDWIIRGVKGEFYPCKPDVFVATYEPASAPVADELPEWEQISAKLERDETLTPLELFVYDNEPAGDDDAWRDQLAAALASAPVAGNALQVATVAMQLIRRSALNAFDRQQHDKLVQDFAALHERPASEAQCSCPSGDGSLRHPCSVHQASEAVRDAEDAARWRWATTVDDNAETLHSIMLCHGGDQRKINERADFYRAALSAQPGAQKNGGGDA